MGGNSTQSSQSYGQQSSSQYSIAGSFSSTLESAISEKQAEILASRQELFETDFMPTWKNAYNEIGKSQEYARNKIAEAEKYSLDAAEDNLAIIDKAIADVSNNSTVLKATMALQSKEINSAFNAAEKATAQNLAKQNLLGTGNGISAVLKAQNDRARAGALSDAYYNTLIQTDTANKAAVQNLLGLRTQATESGIAAKQESANSLLAVENAAASQRTNMLNTLESLMPKPVQDVAYHSKSSSASESQGVSQGTQTSSSNSKQWSFG